MKGSSAKDLLSSTGSAQQNNNKLGADNDVKGSEDSIKEREE